MNWILGATLFGLSNAFLTSSPTPADGVIHCGSSIVEARKLGCHFDVMSYAYYPPECWDPELSTTFINRYRQSWEWMSMDYEPLSVDEILTGNHSNVRAKANFHQLHCAYEWQRLLRALAYGRPLDLKLGDFGHAHHCSRGLLQKDTTDVADGGPVSLKLIVWFASCGLTADEMKENSWEGKL